MVTLFLTLILSLSFSDEKTTIQAVPLSELRIRLESFISERELSDDQQEYIRGILQLHDFIGTDLEGSAVNYSDPAFPGYQREEAVIFGYYAEWCPNCRQNLPSLLRLYEQFNDRGLAVVLNFMYSNPERVRQYVTEQNIPFPVLIGSEDRELNPEIRLETTHYVLRTILEDYRRWGTPFYLITVQDIPDTLYVVAGEFIESELKDFLAYHLRNR